MICSTDVDLCVTIDWLDECATIRPGQTIQMDWIALQLFLPVNCCVVDFTTVFGQLDLKIRWRDAPCKFAGLFDDGVTDTVTEIFKNGISIKNLYRDCHWFDLKDIDTTKNVKQEKSFFIVPIIFVIVIAGFISIIVILNKHSFFSCID
jgi:hypothetical protein